MSHQKVIFYLIIVLMLIIGCKDKSHLNSIYVDQNTSIVLNYGDYKINKLVPLKHKYIQLGEAMKVITHINKIFIQDEMKTSSIFCFDLNGNYQFHLSSGRGPGEFLIPEDFVIYDNKLVVFDSWGNRVFYYDIDGNFLLSKPSLVRPYNVDVFEDNLLIRPYIYGPEELEKDYNLIITDIGFNNIRNNFLKGLHRSEDIAFPRVFSNQYNDHILHSYGYNDTIYKITHKDLRPYLYIEFKGDKISDHLIKHRTPKEVLIEFNNTNKNYASRIWNILESSRYISFDYRHGSEIKHIVYEKGNNKSGVKNISKIRNDSLGINIPFPSYVHDEQYVSILFSDNIDDDSPIKDEMNEYAYLVLYEYQL